MPRFYFPEAVERLRGRFVRLYGEAAAGRCLERLAMMIGRYGVGAQATAQPQRWDEHDAVLITYGDSIREPDRKPLETLKDFADERLRGAFSTVHVLPFFPYSSDDGFSVIDYRKVNEALGDWDDLSALGENFDLMFDLVLNHVSRHSSWFRSYLEGDAPYRDYFIEVDPAIDLSAVVRPRSLPLLTRVTRGNGGKAHVWTTFSDDQIDLNFANPDVLFEFLDVLFYYIAAGARIVRLDAIAYLWKRIGASCIHLPETHEVVKLMRDVLFMAAPHVLLLTETNVPHAENVSYFGEGDEAHMVYQFSLPPLLLHALQTGNGSYLGAWARSLSAPLPGCTYFNFTASHDGVGVRPLQGLLPAEEIDALIERVKARGGQVSTKRDSSGRDSPYELNITYYDALAEGKDVALDIERFLCSQTLPLALQGIPAVYVHSLMGTHNDQMGVKHTGRARSINRKSWMVAELESLMHMSESRERRIMEELLRRLRLRSEYTVFHPDAAQKILDVGDACFGVARTSPDGTDRLVALHNLSAKPQRVKGAVAGAAKSALDLIEDRRIRMSDGIPLRPYQCRWLVIKG